MEPGGSFFTATFGSGTTFFAGTFVVGAFDATTFAGADAFAAAFFGINFFDPVTLTFFAAEVAAFFTRAVALLAFLTGAFVPEALFVARFAADGFVGALTADFLLAFTGAAFFATAFDGAAFFAGVAFLVAAALAAPGALRPVA